MSEASRIVAEIAAGRLDGDLMDVLLAVRHRFEAGASAAMWKAEWDGVAFTEQDVTLDELEIAERLSGRNWSQLNPMTSASNCKAMFVAVLMCRHGLSEKDAKARVSSWPVSALLDGLGEYEVTPAPFGDGEAEPPSS